VSQQEGFAARRSQCLDSNLQDAPAGKIVQLYGRRFTIEETFRDTKDIHFGMGLSATHIKSSARRERILFLGAMAHALLTLLGEAGERAGLDRKLKANTVKKRTLSLYSQGCYWYQAIPAMDDQRLALLMNHFGQVVSEQRLFGRTPSVSGSDDDAERRDHDGTKRTVVESDDAPGRACTVGRSSRVSVAASPWWLLLLTWRRRRV
jgi:hypothetical protein